MSKKYVSEHAAGTGKYSSRRLLRLIGVVVLVLAVTGCPSNGSGGGGGAAPTEADTASALDAVLSAMGVAAAGGGSGLTGVSISGETSPQTIAFTNCVDPLTGYTLDGAFTSTFSDTLPFPIALGGSITLTGAPITTLVFNVALSLDPTAATMTRSGTVTVDGVTHDFSALDLNAGMGGQMLPQPGSIWKSSDSDNTFVLFFLPGNLMLPMEKSGGVYGAGGALAMRYDAGQHRFESHDGNNWWASGGFSADGDTMAVSLGRSTGGFWWVFHGGNPLEWWTNGNVWNHTAWGNSEYNDITYTLAASGDGDSKSGTLAYSGLNFANGPTDPLQTGTLDITVDTTATTLRVDSVTVTNGPTLVGNTPAEMNYVTIGDYLVLGWLDDTAPYEPPPAEVAVFERQ